MGAPSLPPGRYFRMLLIGYFEGIDSGRGIVWRCSDSLSLREFLRLSSRDKVPDHSWLSKTRSRLPHEVHDQIFGWVLALVRSEEHTSELQSLMRISYAVFCLKKKNIITTKIQVIIFKLHNKKNRAKLIK